MAETVQVLSSASSEQTEEIAAELAATLRPGDVVLLSGELGAGKSTFVRGAARALGVTEPVRSPTFTIGHLYRAAGAVLSVGHLDLYRLGSLADEEPDLIADYVGADKITFVEWPAGAGHELELLGHVAYAVELEHAGADARLVRITPGDSR